MNNFAVLSIQYRHFTNAVLIRIVSNTLCHLTCYITHESPLRHKTSRIERGIALPWGAYFCFVAWEGIEQLEPGDTLLHTFIIPSWSLDQTKFFSFRGTVASVLSPSVSPIFDHEHPGQDIILNPGFNSWSAPLGDAPDHWEYPPAPHHNLLYADPIIKTEGRYSCRCDGSALFGNFFIWQELDFSFLDNLPLTLTMDYRGKLHFLNNAVVRAQGDTIRQAVAFPTLDYTWETFSLSLTMPSNLTRLYIRAQNFNQGFPLPFQTWWDNCQVSYTP